MIWKWLKLIKLIKLICWLIKLIKWLLMLINLVLFWFCIQKSEDFNFSVLGGSGQNSRTFSFKLFGSNHFKLNRYQFFFKVLPKFGDNKHNKDIKKIVGKKMCFFHRRGVIEAIKWLIKWFIKFKFINLIRWIIKLINLLIKLIDLILF